jgi:hypothetical protein
LLLLIYHQLSPHGGIRPASRRRSRLALTVSEREEISRGIAGHQSARSMARLLGRSASTVSREISRNGGYDGYRAAYAQQQRGLQMGPVHPYILTFSLPQWAFEGNGARVHSAIQRGV